MGHEKSSIDWLPAGWKVQVRVRKSGKKEKCYVDPSNERKFYSKPEVVRYLKNVEVNRVVCEETKNKSTSCRSAIKFVVKEAVTEELPEGWIKETRVTQRGNKIRRDPYYIDPVSGHLFRSMKEVLRYLDSEKMGRRSSKLKDQSPIHLEPRHDSLSSSAETEEKRTAENKGEKQVIGDQSLKSDAAAMSNVNLPEAKKSEQKRGKETSCENSSHVAEVPPENQQIRNGLEATKYKKKRLNDKKGAELPRRTSKRLAGIEVDLSLETIMHTRVRRAAARQISEAEAAARQISEAEVNSADKCENLANSDEHAKRLKTGTEADEKHERLDVLPPGDVIFPEEPAKQGVAECKGDEKLELPLDMSFKDLWKDPCIEFAIKTLTGAMSIEDETKVPMNQGPSSNLPDAVPGSCQDLPSKDIWADPCFEFAVKTLTGDMPMMNHTTIDAIIQQPMHNSPEVIGHNGFTLTNFMSAGFSNGSGSVSFRRSNLADAPPHKQQLDGSS